MKILHTADIHLDSPFSSLDPKKSEERRGELRAAFSSMMKYAKESGVELVLIAGDLFDYGFVTKRTADMLVSTFSDMSEVKIVISPGNHDAYVKGGVYDGVDFPENVYIFDSEELSRFEFPELGVDVYGYAFTSEKLETSPLALKSAEDNGRVKLLCIHCDIHSPISRYAPVTREDIAAFGADYAALGHVHNPASPETVGGCTYAYSGPLVGRSFDEPGEKGAILVEIDRDTKKMSFEKKVFSDARYEIEKLDITACESDGEVRSKLEAMIKNKGYTSSTSLRVILMGAVPPTYIPHTEAIEDGIEGIFSLQVKDMSEPIYGAESLDSDMTVRGELWRYLKEKMSTGESEDREIAIRALRYALAALDGR